MLLGLKGVTLRIGATVLLDQVEFSLEPRERVALVGRNGAGKSTLFKIISGEIQPEDGQVIRQDGIKLARLEQAVPAAKNLRIRDVVAQGLGEVGQAILTLETLDHQHAERELTTEEVHQQLTAQTVLTEHHAWHLQSELDQMLTKMQLNGEQEFASLSGGMKRKVMLARAMVNQPDVLLLDEPTNHLDIPAIEMLEEQIRQFPGAIILVSHDRAFMRKLATRVCDLDRGHLKSWSGGYEGYLKGKADFLAAEEKANALFDKRLAQEEVWIRRGIEARRTRNEGRVRALFDMRKQFADRRTIQGKANVQVQEAERSGKLVAEVDQVSLTLGDQRILDNFSNTILRGEKIGVLGPNGIGKTTALKVLLGQITPNSGTIRLGTKLEIAWFDQLRSQFNEEDTAVDIIGGGKEYIEQGGQSKHVMGYLQDFLFTPDRARQPVRSLSGGERARLLLAQLFAQPSNLLMLDEPTNDLDIETLELLEEKLSEYTGTLLLVSHDREFLNRIVTRCLVFEGNGQVGDYTGGFDDWLRQRTCDPWANTGATKNNAENNQNTNTHATSNANASDNANAQTTGQYTNTSITTAPPVRGRKLSYKETRELEELPRLIERLEAEQAELVAAISDPNFYAGDSKNVESTNKKLADLESELAKAYNRWSELEP